MQAIKTSRENKAHKEMIELNEVLRKRNRSGQTSEAIDADTFFDTERIRKAD